MSDHRNIGGGWERVSLHFPHPPEPPLIEILIAEFNLLGFDGILEKADELTAWCKKGNIPHSAVDALIKKYKLTGHVRIHWVIERATNWNLEWEKNYTPVWITSDCQVRASFHPPAPGIPYDLVINPGMAFGTGHHETTRLMAETLLTLPCSGKKILDMGCGTGILAILASRMGATAVTAIDNFPNACLITRENARKNRCGNIQVMEGDHHNIPEQQYDIILVNITRNIIMEMLPDLAEHLKSRGILLLSGFFFEDRNIIIPEAEKYGLKYKNHITENSWIALTMTRG